MRNKYLALAATALLALGAGCASTDTTNDNTSLQVPANSNGNVNETIVVDKDDTATEEAEGTETDVDSTDDQGEEVTEVDEDEAGTEDALEDDADEAGNEDDAAAIQEFDLVATQFEFTPGTITVNKGDTVKLNLSSDDVPHGFSLSAFGVSETLTPGKTKTVEFVADQAGTFTFTCNIVCGAGHSSMSGQLIVEE